MINVAAPLLQKEIKEKLLSSKTPVYRYIRNLSRIEMQFEADSDESPEKVIRMTKKLIRTIKYGNIIMYRVLVDGQFFEGGQVYSPDDKEYLATRPAK